MGPKGRDVYEFCGVSLCLIYPRLGTEEGRNLKLPITAVKGPINPGFPSNRSGKEHLNKAENFYIIMAVLQSNITEKNCGSSPLSIPEKSRWVPQNSHEVVAEHHNIHAWVMFKRSK